MNTFRFEIELGGDVDTCNERGILKRARFQREELT